MYKILHIPTGQYIEKSNNREWYWLQSERFSHTSLYFSEVLTEYSHNKLIEDITASLNSREPVVIEEFMFIEIRDEENV